MGTPIRVVLVEDNEVFRDALELLLGLEADVQVVAALADGRAVVETCLATRPGVVLMDYRLPGADGVALVAEVGAAVPGVAVVGLTAAAEGGAREAMVAAGAVECLSKDTPLDEILAAVRRAGGRPE